MKETLIGIDVQRTYCSRILRRSLMVSVYCAVGYHLLVNSLPRKSSSPKSYRALKDSSRHVLFIIFIGAREAASHIAFESDI